MFLYAAGIGHIDVSTSEYRELIDGPYLDELLAGVALVIVHPDGSEDRPVRPPGGTPVVVGWAGTDDVPPWVDVALDADDRLALVERVERVPQAAVSLAVLLRQTETLPIGAALAAESAVYSMLQGGPEFAAWRAATPATPDPEPDRPTVLIDRDGDRLLLTLDRPHRHNAISMRLRDELHGALTVALVDDSIRAVVIRGNGPSFCSGGDLGEFGRRPDPVTAHVTRLARSPAALIERLRDRTEVRIHGSTFGGGIEMAAFAGRVVAAPDARVALPEVSLGLIPGAGGTASLTRRIGRQRTAELGLVGKVIDAATALEWGLVDEISPRGESLN
jgi:enoyl-CoA hydratase/carnithine racemase